MALTGSSWLAFWEFVEISGAVIVTVGVVGEYIADFTKLLKGNARKTRLRKISTLTLIAGLAIELIGLSTTSHAFNVEVAKANDDAKRAGTNAAASYERAAKLEFAAAELKAKINETDTNVAKIDPLNQPIGVLTASVSLFENGTNRSHVDFSSPLGGQNAVRLKLRNSKNSDSGWPFELVCTSGNAMLSTTNFSSGTNFPGSANFSADGIFWDLEFGSSSMARAIDIIPPNATVQDADDLDTVEFDAVFLRPETETAGGKIILTINSKKKVFEIPPQRVLKPEEIPLTKAEKDQGNLVRFISPKINKTVTLVSWAHKE